MDDTKYFVFETTDEFKELIDYLYDNADCVDKSLLNDGRKYLLIEKNELFKSIRNKIKFVKLIKNIYNDNHVCNNCGCISNMFIVDYRGQICISKVYNCPFCHVLNDEAYRDINHTKDILKFI